MTKDKLIYRMLACVMALAMILSAATPLVSYATDLPDGNESANSASAEETVSASEEDAPAEETPDEEAAPVEETPDEEAASVEETPDEEAAPVEETSDEDAAPTEDTQETPVDMQDEQGTDEVRLGTALSAFKAGMKVGKAAEWTEKGELAAIAYFQHENGQNSLIDFAGGKDDPVLLAENNALLLAVTEADQGTVQVQMESDSDQAYVLVGEGKEKVFLDREDHVYDLTEYLTEDNILAIFGGNADVNVVSVIFEDAQLKAMNLEGAQAIVDVAFSVEDPASDTEPEDESDELAMPAFSESVTVDDVVVSVKADSDVFPEDATLSVTKVPAKEQTQAEEAVDGKREDGQNVAVSYTFDIKVLDADGNEIQPADGKKVHVSFSTAEVADQNLKTQVYHIAEEENGAVTAEKLDVHEAGDTATAQTDGFSLYTVEFTYDNLQYVMEGDTSVALADILKEIGLTGEATAVEVSSPDLFSASNETGKWVVTAHQAFTSTEWMKVTINGVVYEIVVTDATKPGKPTITVKLVGATAFRVSWGAVSGATQYHVRWKKDGAQTWSAVHTTTDLSFKISGLNTKKKYTIAVEAGNSAGWSGYQTTTATTGVNTVVTYNKDSVASVVHGTAGGTVYGMNEHKIRYGDYDYPGYCIDRNLGTDENETNYTFNISNISQLGTSYPAKAARLLPLIAALGYSGYRNSEIEDARRMFNVKLTSSTPWVELLGATQGAIWGVTENSNYNGTKSLSEIRPYLRQRYGSTDGVLTADRIARAALDIYNSGDPTITISCTKSSETASTVTYTVNVQCARTYGGYDMEVSGLPSGYEIKNLSAGSGSFTRSGTKFTSLTNYSTPTYTDSFKLVVPKSSSSKTITFSATSVIAVGNAQNNTRYVKHPANRDLQNMVYMTASGNPVTTTQNLTVPAQGSFKITVNKQDGQGHPVKDVVMKLQVYNGSDYVDTGRTETTDANGSAVFNNCVINGTNGGRYRVREVSAPAGYQSDGDFFATINGFSGGWRYKSSYTDEVSEQGSSNQAGNNTTLKVYVPSVNPTGTTANDMYAKLNATGKAKVSGSPATMKVMHATKGDYTVYVINPPAPKFNITVQKRDLNTGNAVTSGVTYRLEKWNGSSWTSMNNDKSINSSGVVSWTDLTPTDSSNGTFRITEYEVTNTQYKKDDKFEVIVNPNDGKMTYVSSLVAKKDATANGSEVKADVNLLNGNTASRTIMKGVKDNNDGKYDFTIWQDDQHPTQQNLTVSKIVKVDGTNRRISGMVFSLMHKRANGQWEKLGELKEENPVASPGEYRIPRVGNNWQYPTINGDTYRVDETSAPDGVVNSGWKSSEFQWREDIDLDLKYTAEDYEPKGYLGVQKVNKETGAALSGVEFTVTAAGDIKTTVGGSTKTWYVNGAQVAKGVTDANGFFKAENLPYGTYTVTETKHPDEFHYEDISFNVTVGNPAGYSGSTIYTNPQIGVPTYPAGMATKADGSYTYVVVNNKPVHPSTSVAKLTERTLNPNGRVVAFDAATGRYTEDKIPGTYYNDQRAKFTLTATNTGDVDLYDLNMKDVMSPELWTTVKRLEGARSSDVTFRQVNNEPLALGAELKTGSTITTTQGKTVTVTNVTYDDANRTFNIWFDKLEIGDSFNIQITYTLYNNDNINKQNLPNDVYLYAKYLKQGTRGDKNDVPEDSVLHHDVDKLNVVCQGEISVEKKDNHGNALKDVHFQLVDAQNNAVPFVHKDDGSYSATLTKDNGDWVSAADSGKPTTTDLITNAAGKVEIVELPEGDYKLVETKTVEGQTLMAQPVEIKMPFDEAGAEKAGVDHNIYFDGINHYYHQYYSITNTAVFKLPATGASNHMMLTSTLGLAGLCVVFIAVLRMRRKHG